MTLQEIKRYVDTCLNKDSSGNSLSPQEYNTLLEANIFNFVANQIRMYRQFVAAGTPHDDVMFTALLIDALQKQTTATLSSGYFTLPTDMLFLNDLYGTYNAHQKKIDVVSSEEYAKRLHNLMSKPIAYFPVATIRATSCYVYPSTMTALYVDYIAKPVVPIYDYYIDANYNIQYLAASATHMLTAGEYGSAGQTSGTLVTSLTVESDLPEELGLRFADYILSKVSIRDRDVNMYQAVQNEIQNEK